MFKLGSEVLGGKKYITIPQFENGECVGIKKRCIEPNTPKDGRFTREANCKSPLFNSDVIPANLAEIYLCEGEFDVISMQANGITNVVSSTIGAKPLSGENLLKLDNAEKVIVLYDPDEKGQEGAREVIPQFGKRAWNVILPDGLDVNEYFLAGRTGADLLAYVAENARQFVDTEKTNSASPNRFSEAMITGPEAFMRYAKGLENTSWTVKDIVPENVWLSVGFGPPSAGKSFISLDRELCIATNTNYHGHAVKQCPVVYVAAEGAAGTVVRIAAWLKYHGKTWQDLGDNFNFYWRTTK